MNMNNVQLNRLSEEIIGAAIEVHNYLGPGLLEKTYQEALMAELKLRDIRCEKEVKIPIIYKGETLDSDYRADIIVDDKIILELKATEQDNPLFYKQLYTYLKLSNIRLGLLINFNRERLVKGLKRVVNEF